LELIKKCLPLLQDKTLTTMQEITQKLVIRDAGRIDGISGLLLLGEPGTGKTRFAKILAAEWADHFIKYQCHEGTGKEELLYDIDVAGVVQTLNPHRKEEVSASFLNKGLLPLACELSQKGRVVLLLDEIEKGRQALDNFLLDFLQSGEVYDPNLGSFKANLANIIFIATSNEQRMLSEPLYRRLRRLRLNFPTEQELFLILQSMVETAEFEAVGTERIKWLIALAFWYRKQDVVKKITPPEIARLISDLAFLADDKDAKLFSLFSWFSPHQEDWAVLLKYNQGGEKYLKGKL
jgi:MoxR-like ATPase